MCGMLHYECCVRQVVQAMCQLCYACGILCNTAVLCEQEAFRTLKIKFKQYMNIVSGLCVWYHLYIM